MFDADGREIDNRVFGVSSKGIAEEQCHIVYGVKDWLLGEVSQGSR